MCTLLHVMGPSAAELSITSAVVAAETNIVPHHSPNPAGSYPSRMLAS
jgi:hypothetical protein